MSLKKQIVFKNEFSTKTASGGSRGASPGRYTYRYAARSGAAEPITPIKQTAVSDYVEKYAARRSASEVLPVRSLKSDVDVLRKPSTGKGGFAFSRDSVSLSDRELKGLSRHIQNLFDGGKTVMRTVVSFDTGYLKERGVLPEDFEMTRRGSARGKVDQLKLRRAIQKGLSYMGRDYDDLTYVGVVQVDTKHVHCHLTMVDAGPGTLAVDGKQKGKISQRSIKKFRRGLEMELDHQRKVPALVSQYDLEVADMKSAVRTRLYRELDDSGILQLLVASLPEDNAQWRYASNAKPMKRPNRLMDMYLTTVFEEADMAPRVDAAYARIDDYVHHRATTEGLTLDEVEALRRKGVDGFKRRVADGVYANLRELLKDAQMISTRAIDVASNPEVDLKDGLGRMVYRMKRYSARRDHHQEKRRYYKGRLAELEKQPDTPIKQAFEAHYQFEMDYHHALSDKYLHLIGALPDYNSYRKRLETLDKLRGLALGNSSLLLDEELPALDPGLADELGVLRYGVRGGRFTKAVRHILEQRRDHYETAYLDAYTSFEETLINLGLQVKGLSDGHVVELGTVHRFSDVKYFDLHDMTGDFAKPLDLPDKVIAEYKELAAKRRRLLQPVVDYLEKTGQAQFLNEIDVAGCERMTAFSDGLQTPDKISEAPSIGEKSSSKKTVSVDYLTEKTVIPLSILESEVDFYFE